MTDLKLIRRDKEMQLLWQAYDTLKDGHGRVCFISGEAGMGKSVLLDMFFRELEEKSEETLIASTFCSIRSEYSIPYQPFKEVLKQFMQEVKENEKQEKEERPRKEKLKDALSFSARMLLEHAPGLIDNFIPMGTVLSALGNHILGNMEIKHEKQGSSSESTIVEEYINTLKAISKKYPLVLFIDNLQWIDKPSVNLLYQLSVALRNSPVLIVGSYRCIDIDMLVDGEKHPMTHLINEVKINHGNVFIRLNKAEEDAKRMFLDNLLDREANIYTANFRQTLFERTEGNPLFVHEMICLLKEKGILIQNELGIWTNKNIPDWQSYPVRIEGIIHERIGRLEDSMIEILSQASVQGTRFIVQVLSRTIGETSRDLLVILSRKLQKQYHLVNEGDCIRLSQGIVSEFNFSNYIFQQYLYQELSASHRMLLHGDIAVILEDIFQNNINDVAGDIARHYELAGEPEKALKYIAITVDKMLEISAFREASSLITKVLEQYPIEIDDHTRLTYTAKQCLCIRSTKGWGSPITKHWYEQAEILSKKTSCFDYIDIILFGQWAIYLIKLDLDHALELAQRYYSRAKEKDSITMEFMSLITLINTYFWLGEYSNANKYIKLFQQKEAACSPETKVTEEALILYHMFHLLVSFQLANYDSALDSKKSLLNAIATTKDRFYKCIAYQALTWQEYLAGNREQSGEYALTLLNMAQESGYPFYIAIGDMFYGAFIASENLDEGILQIQKGYKLLSDAANHLNPAMHIIYALLLYNTYLNGGKYSEIEAGLASIIETAISKKERCYLSELYIIQGRYYQVIGEVELSKNAFKNAKDISIETESIHAEKILKKFTS